MTTAQIFYVADAGRKQRDVRPGESFDMEPGWYWQDGIAPAVGPFPTSDEAAAEARECACPPSQDNPKPRTDELLSRDCPGCGRVMSNRERREQGVCDPCAEGGA